MTKVFLIAGEASGDFLGGALMRDLKRIDPDTQFSGVGGGDMQAQGLQSLFPMTDLSIMGLVEVLRHLPLLLKRIKQTTDAILAQKPDILVTIDSPDFCLRVAKKIKRADPNIKIVHYVAPTVWAWRPGRAKKIAAFLDGLLCLFPFEPPYFTKHGLQAKFVGHPLTKLIRLPTDMDKAAFLSRHNLDANKPILCVLPGSRRREIHSLLPVFIETVKKLRRNMVGLQVILPTLPHLKDKIVSVTGGQDIRVFVPETADEKYTAFNLSQVALHASGTVALELALCDTAMVTAYKVSPVSAFIGRLLLTTRYVNLVNILLNRPVVPEMLQEQATPEQLTPIVQALLTNPGIRNIQQDELRGIAQSLNENAPLEAAHFVKSFV